MPLLWPIPAPAALVQPHIPAVVQIERQGELALISMDVPVAPERARAVGSGFLEADLLGFVTHGLVKVPDNLRWLDAGETSAAGDPAVIVDRPGIGVVEV